MSIRLYMDVHVPMAITRGLRRREVDVLTSQEDGTDRFSDDELLDRATALQRALVSMDTDLRREAVTRQRSGKFFSGVITADQSLMTIGQWIADLELIAKIANPEDLANRLEYLPL
jgi:predicted nuclease of predicted toxin-antitoxin system